MRLLTIIKSLLYLEWLFLRGLFANPRSEEARLWWRFTRPAITLPLIAILGLTAPLTVIHGAGYYDQWNKVVLHWMQQGQRVRSGTPMTVYELGMVYLYLGYIPFLTVLWVTLRTLKAGVASMLLDTATVPINPVISFGIIVRNIASVPIAYCAAWMAFVHLLDPEMAMWLLLFEWDLAPNLLTLSFLPFALVAVPLALILARVDTSRTSVLITSLVIIASILILTRLTATVVNWGPTPLRQLAELVRLPGSSAIFSRLDHPLHYALLAQPVLLWRFAKIVGWKF